MNLRHALYISGSRFPYTGYLMYVTTQSASVVPLAKLYYFCDIAVIGHVSLSSRRGVGEWISV